MTALEANHLNELAAEIGDAMNMNDFAKFLTKPNAALAAHFPPAIRAMRPIDCLGSVEAFSFLIDFVRSAKSGDMA